MSETGSLALGQINIVVRDMRKSVAFYRVLGLSITEIPLPEWAPHHASGVTSNGVRVEFDSVAFAKQWNPGLDETKLGAAVLPFFHISSREESIAAMSDSHCFPAVEVLSCKNQVRAQPERRKVCVPHHVGGGSIVELDAALEQAVCPLLIADIDG